MLTYFLPPLIANHHVLDIHLRNTPHKYAINQYGWNTSRGLCTGETCKGNL